MTALSADPICREHLVGRPHPERPERFDAVIEALRQAGSLDRMLHLAPRSATEEELLLCHTPAYLQVARHDVETGRHYLSTGATQASPCASATALCVTWPSITLRPLTSAGCFWQASARPRSARSSM